MAPRHNRISQICKCIVPNSSQQLVNCELEPNGHYVGMPMPMLAHLAAAQMTLS